jgi:hypothetical protein
MLTGRQVTFFLMAGRLFVACEPQKGDDIRCSAQTHLQSRFGMKESTEAEPQGLAQKSSQLSAVVVGRVCCVLQVAVGTLTARKRSFCCTLMETHVPEIKRGKKPKKNQSTPLTRDDDGLFFASKKPVEVEATHKDRVIKVNMAKIKEGCAKNI